MRCWVKANPVDVNKMKLGAPGYALLKKEPTLTADFSIREDANPKSRQKGMVRCAANLKNVTKKKMFAQKRRCANLSTRTIILILACKRTTALRSPS